MDLRLLIPAATVWAVSVVGLIAPLSVTVAVVVAAALLCGGGAVSAVCGWVSWHVVALLVVASGLAATCGMALILRVDAVRDHPLARTDGKTTVTAIVRDDPAPLGAHGRVRLRVDVVAMGQRAVHPARAELIAPVAEWSELVPGQRVRSLVRVRPPPGADLTVARLTAAGSPTVVGAPPRHHRIAAAVRARMQILSTRALGPDAAGLLPGLVLGDTSALDPDVRDDFRAAGLSHLTAVSGANFAIVCGAVLALVRAVGTPPRTTAVIGAVVIVCFVILVRPSPSVLRAAMMGAVGLLAMVASRRSQALPALGTAIIVGLLWWPDLATAPGFALSVAATGGLVLWAPSIRDRLRQLGVPGGVADVLAMAVAAQLVTAPLIAMISGRYSLVSILANVLVAPVVAVIGVVGTAAAVLGALGPPGGPGAILGELLIRALTPQLWWMLTCARVAGGARWATVPVPDGPMGAAVVLVVTVASVLILRAGAGRWVIRRWSAGRIVCRRTLARWSP